MSKDLNRTKYFHQYHQTHKPSALYVVWRSMKKRCSNPRDQSYANYGGRGIRVCRAWLDFKSFEKDMKKEYKKGLWLERINNNKGYSKKNCCWATPTEQQNNRRNSTRIHYNGLVKTLTQWARVLNIKTSTVRQRYYVYKWDINKCLNTL